MTDETKLLPCPFCGGEAILMTPAGSRPYVMCATRFCAGPQNSTEIAIAAWNRRALDPALLKERDEARARAAAAFKMAADVCTSIINDYDVMKADGKTYEPLRVQSAAKGLVSLARQDIRALSNVQERDALAKVRAEAMREAASIALDHTPGKHMRGTLAAHVTGATIEKAILTRADEIEKGEL